MVSLNVEVVFIWTLFTETHSMCVVTKILRWYGHDHIMRCYSYGHGP